MSKYTKAKVGSSVWAMLMSLLLIMLCGCTHTWNYESDDIAYRYYVIDAHADVPDANFKTFGEAAIYKKEYAEHHDYVIVKIDERYNVYNMELNGSLETFVEKNEN